MNTNVTFMDRRTPPHIVTLVLTASLSALAMNIFLPSLPQMAVYFGTDYAMMQLSVSAYLTGSAVLQLVIGPLSDRYGRRPTLIAAVAVFLIATVICLFAETFVLFMIGRLLQTSVVAGLVLSRAIVRDVVPMEQAASMIGYVTMGMTLVPMLGPSLGGLINEVFVWQASFVLLLACGLAIGAVIYFDLGETNRQRSESFGAQFAAWPQLLTSPIFWGYTLTATFSSGAFFCFLGAGPLVGDLVFGLQPSEIGLAFFFISAGYMAGNYVSGRYSSQLGITNMMMLGVVVMAVGTMVTIGLDLADTGASLAFFAPQAIIGLGNGISLPSANAGIVSVRPELAGSASGLGGAITIGSGALFSMGASWMVTETSGVMPLLTLMLVSALLGIGAILLIRYARAKDGDAET